MAKKQTISETIYTEGESTAASTIETGGDHGVAGGFIPSQAISKMVQMMAQMSDTSIEDFSQWYEQAMALSNSQQLASTIPGGEAASNKESISTNYSPAGFSTKEVEEAFGIEGEALTEDTKQKIATLFEAALNVKLVVERKKIRRNSSRNYFRN